MFINRVAGQSSVELLVSAAVIVPIVLLIPTLANMLLLQTEAHKAARYVAWERVAYSQQTLQQKNNRLAEEVEERFLLHSQDGFGDSVGQVQVTPWRDWGSKTPNAGDTGNGIIEYGRSVGVQTVSSSATSGYVNASSHLAQKSGPNAIDLNTMQSGKLSIPLKSSSSLLQLAADDAPIDPVTGVRGYYLKSSSALIVDSWTPANEQVFHDRVASIDSARHGFLGWYQSPVTKVLRSSFDEIDLHMYVDTPGTNSNFDMVDPTQSQNIPDQYKSN